MVTPEEHAARLRLIRRIGGMLHHQDCAKVMSAKQMGDAEDVLIALRSATPMTEEEYAELLSWLALRYRHRALNGCHRGPPR